MNLETHLQEGEQALARIWKVTALRGVVAIVFAVTDPELGKKGLSAFIVPTNSPGFKPQKLEEKLGIKASDTCAIVLENCEIPEDHLLGPRGKGLAIMWKAPAMPP